MADKIREAMNRFIKNMPKESILKVKGYKNKKGGTSSPGSQAAVAAGSLVAACALSYGTYNSVYSVSGGHRAVVFNRLIGMKEHVYGEGLNFIIPWFEQPYIYDIRTRPCNLQTLTGSKDLQMVTIGVRVLHKPSPVHLVWIYRHLGINYDERILPSLMNECAKAVVARYNASELLTKREQVSADISKDLSVRARGFHVLLEDVAITHLSFSPEYARAVEAKQVAQQDAERAKYIVLGAKQEKLSIITRAKGEAESAVLIGKSVKKNPGFMKLRRIEAAKDIADIVADSGNKVYLNADTLLLNLMGNAEDKFEKTVKQPKKWL